MEILSFLFRSGLPLDEVSRVSEQRAGRYRQVQGLLQKYYVRDPVSGHMGGVFLFESTADLAAFRASELAKSTGSAYEFTDDPQVRVLDVLKMLHPEV